MQHFKCTCMLPSLLFKCVGFKKTPCKPKRSGTHRLMHGGPPPYLDQTGLLRIDDRLRYITQCFLVFSDKDFYALNCKQRGFTRPPHNVGAAAGLIHYMTESKTQIQYRHRPPVEGFIFSDFF